MIHRVFSAIPAALPRRALILVVLGLMPILLLSGARSMGAAESAVPDQCVACHTDRAKLKALTPPDPPVAETGEG